MDICEVRRGICATIHARIDDLVGTVVSVVIGALFGALVSVSDFVCVLGLLSI